MTITTMLTEFVCTYEKGKPPTADTVEKWWTLHVLELEGGNKQAAARVLGFDRRTLYRKLKQWGVEATRAEVEARADRLDAELAVYRAKAKGGPL